MKLWIPTVCAALALGAWTASGALAANDQAAMALHVSSRTSKNLCSIQLPTSCTDYSTSAASTGFYTIYLTVANYDSTGIAGMQFGVNYGGGPGTGIDVATWKSCSDLEFKDDTWPASGSGNVITWDYLGNCQGDLGTGNITRTPLTAGAFEVTTYSADAFSIIPRPADGRAKVSNCQLVETDITDDVPSRLGSVSFGGGIGYNPCLGPQTPVHPTTWGSIKALYEK
jgi:hypothetical protein